MMAKKKKDPTFSMDSDSPADQRAAEDGAEANAVVEAVQGGRENAGETASEIRESRRKTLEAVGVEADMRDLQDSIKSDGMTESEAGGQLERMLREAEGVEPEEIDTLPPEERQELKEKAEESGSIEDVAAYIEEQLKAAEAGEGAEGEPSREPVPWSAIQEATGVSPEDVTVRAKIDGEEMDLSLEEAVQGYQRQKDYTEKTMELSEQRKAVREDADRLAQQFDALGLALQQAGVGEQQLQAIEQQYQQVRAVQQQYTEEQVRQAAEEGAEAVRQEFGWNSESDWSIAKAQLATTAEKLGFTPEEYGEVVDPRYVKLLEYARRGMEGDSRKDPPPMKPGQGNRNPGRLSRKQREFGKARERLARTGSETAAAEVLEGILAQEGN